MKNRSRFLLMDMLFEGGRMFVGGISVAFLLSRGILAADIAVIKALQATVVFFAEIPTGVFGDRYGYKASLIASVVSALVGFLLYLFSYHITSFLLGEFFLAISLCFWSGSFEAWASEETGIDSCASQTKSFFHLNNAINQLGVVIFGFTGGFLSGINNYHYAYWGASVVMGVLLVLIVGSPHKKRPHASLEVKQVSDSLGILKSSLHYAINAIKIREILLISIVLQFLAQPILQYWQPLFLSLKSGLSGQGLGTIFAAYSVSIALASYIAKWKEQIPGAFLMLLWILLYVMMGKLANFSFVLQAFCLQHACYAILRVRYTAALTHAAPSHLRASILSINSFVSKGGMIGSLLLLSYLLKNQSLSYQSMFAGLGVVGLVAFVIIKLLDHLQAHYRILSKLRILWKF